MRVRLADHKVDSITSLRNLPRGKESGEGNPKITALDSSWPVLLLLLESEVSLPG
jgi:hypothetical protein